MAKARRIRPPRTAGVRARSNKLAVRRYALHSLARSEAHLRNRGNPVRKSASPIVIIGLAALYAFSLPSSASSLECGPPRSAKEKFDKATAVFQGKVIGAEERELPNPIGPSKKYRVFRFRVEQWWKGGNKEEAETYDFGEESFRFENEERYLVYAFGDKAKLTTNNCRRTKDIERAQEDLNFLGKGRKPEP